MIEEAEATTTVKIGGKWQLEDDNIWMFGLMMLIKLFDGHFFIFYFLSLFFLSSNFLLKTKIKTRKKMEDEGL